MFLPEFADAIVDIRKITITFKIVGMVCLFKDQQRAQLAYRLPR